MQNRGPRAGVSACADRDLSVPHFSVRPIVGPIRCVKSQNLTEKWRTERRRFPPTSHSGLEAPSFAAGHTGFPGTAVFTLHSEPPAVT